MKSAAGGERLASGQGQFAEMASGGRIFPPLFIWTVSQSHEDLPAGFQRAAELYQARASYRTEVTPLFGVAVFGAGVGDFDRLSGSARHCHVCRVHEPPFQHGRELGCRAKRTKP